MVGALLLLAFRWGNSLNAPQAVVLHAEVGDEVDEACSVLLHDDDPDRFFFLAGTAAWEAWPAALSAAGVHSSLEAAVLDAAATLPFQGTTVVVVHVGSASVFIDGLNTLAGAPQPSALEVRKALWLCSVPASTAPVRQHAAGGASRLGSWERRRAGGAASPAGDFA